MIKNCSKSNAIALLMSKCKGLRVEINIDNKKEIVQPSTVICLESILIDTKRTNISVTAF